MVLRIFAVIGIVSIITILRTAEYKAYDFDYTKIPCGVGSSGNRGVNCDCETTDSETRKFSHLTRENRNHLK